MELGSRQKALLANWDLKDGKFLFQHEPLFFIETNNDFRPRLIWDGGSRIFACTFGNQKTGGFIKGKADGFKYLLGRG